MDSGSIYRSDDDGWRNGAHTSLSDQGLTNSDDCCVSCGRGRTCDDQLRPAQVYGFAIPAGYVSSADRRSAGVVDRNIDWEFVKRSRKRAFDEQTVSTPQRRHTFVCDFVVKWLELRSTYRGPCEGRGERQDFSICGGSDGGHHLLACMLE